MSLLLCVEILDFKVLAILVSVIVKDQGSHLVYPKVVFLFESEFFSFLHFGLNKDKFTCVGLEH